jgi:hypothetical protein
MSNLLASEFGSLPSPSLTQSVCHGRPDQVLQAAYAFFQNGPVTLAGRRSGSAVQSAKRCSASATSCSCWSGQWLARRRQPVTLAPVTLVAMPIALFERGADWRFEPNRGVMAPVFLQIPSQGLSLPQLMTLSMLRTCTICLTNIDFYNGLSRNGSSRTCWLPLLATRFRRDLQWRYNISEPSAS